MPPRTGSPSRTRPAGRPTAKGAGALRLALLAACLALAVPAALAAPHLGNMADAGTWAYALGTAGQLVAPAYAEVATDDALQIDARYDLLIVAPDQISVTYTKNATAGISDYVVYADIEDDDGNGDLEHRNVTAVAGNGTTVHTVSFDGDVLGKSKGEDDYYRNFDSLVAIMIGNVTNGTGMLWGGWDADWDDPSAYLYESPKDGQRPAVSTAKLTGANRTIAVTYDEPVWYDTAADYTVVLSNGTSVDAHTVLNADGDQIRPGVSADADSMHVLVLRAPLDLDDIVHLSIEAQNVLDRADYTVNSTGAKNALLNDTVAVEEGYPPKLLGAAITGPLELTVTFDEPANSSPASYPAILIWSDLVHPDARSRTATAVAGNGTATHVLTLDRPDRPILLPPAGPKATGWIEVSGVSDTNGNSMGAGEYQTANFTDGRSHEDVPRLVAAKFTGPNEVTVSYYGSASVPDGGYRVLADWDALRNKASGPDAPDYNFTVILSGGSNRSLQLDHSRVEVSSFSGNGTAVHRLKLAGDGVTAAATGLINITGAARPGAANATSYFDALVYDEQLVQIKSAWVGRAGNTAFVEYGEPALGQLSAYPSATVHGLDASGNAVREDRGVVNVTTGQLATIRDAPGPIGRDLANDQEYFKSAAIKLDGSGANGMTIEYFAGNTPPGSDSTKRYINGTFTPYSISIERPTPEAVIVREPPPLMNKNASATPTGYIGELVLLDGERVKVHVVPATAKIVGNYHAYNSNNDETTLVDTTLFVGDAAWLVTPTATDPDLPSPSSTVYYAPHSRTDAVSYPDTRAPYLDGAMYFGPHTVVAAEEHTAPDLAGSVHMIELAAPPLGSALNVAMRGVLAVGGGVSGANGNPIEEIGVHYLKPVGDKFWLKLDRQRVNADRTADIALTERGLVDFGTDRPPGANVPLTNPSFHVNGTGIALQMLFAEPVDADSINRTRITVDHAGGIQFPLTRYPDPVGGQLVAAVTDRLVTVKVPDAIASDLRGRNYSLSSYIDRAVVGTYVTLWDGFAAYADGRQIGGGTYYARTSSLPAPAAVTTAAMTGPNAFNLSYSDPLYAAYESLVLEPGGSRNVLSVEGNGTRWHRVMFDGVEVPDTAGGSVRIIGIDTTAGVYNNRTLVDGEDLKKLPIGNVVTLPNGNVRPISSSISIDGVSNITVTLPAQISFSKIPGTDTPIPGGIDVTLPLGTTATFYTNEGIFGTGYVPGVEVQDIRPLNPDRAALVGSGAVSFASAGITSGNEITVRYTGPVNASASDYTGLTLSPGGARNVTAAAGNGTAVHMIAFDGEPAEQGAAGTIDIAALVGPGGLERFSGADGQAVSDERRPARPATPGEDPPAAAAAAAARLASLASNGTHLTVNYTLPVDAGTSDYTITGASGASIALTGITGSGSASHLVGHASVPDGTWMQVSIAPLDDEGSGNAYAGTQFPLAIAALREGAAALIINGSSYIGTVSGVRGDSFYIGRFGSGALDPDNPANNTVTFQPSLNVTVRAPFAEVTFPPGTVARSVPGDGLIELYAVNYTDTAAAITAFNFTGNATAFGSVVEVGDEDVHIWFDRPIRLLLGNQSGLLAFYVNNTNDRIVPILERCPADSTAAAMSVLKGTGECQIDSGADKAIHTYHLTLFGTVNGTGAQPVNGTTPGPANGTMPGPANATTSDPVNGMLTVTIMPAPTDPRPIEEPQQPPAARFFGAGGGGAGGGGGGGGGGARIASGSGALVLHSAAWDCDEGTIRMAFSGAQGPEVTVVSASGSVAAGMADAQDMPGRTVYEAPLPLDTVISIRALAVDGRAVSSVSEVVRTGGACTGEVAFAQYTPGQPTGVTPSAPSAADGDAAAGQPARGAEPGQAAAAPEGPGEPDGTTEQPGGTDGAMPAGAERPAFEIEEGRDASYYVKRYAEQHDYREWFDTNYPQYADICEAVGADAGCVEAHLAARAGADGVAPGPDADAGAEPATADTAAPGDDDSGCLIATAAYGTELAPQVQALREYRDGTLLATGPGSAFMSSFSAAYYAFSPHVADLEREHPAVRQAVAAMIAPLLYSLQVATQADPASDGSVVAHGVAALLLVAGLYVGAPAAGAAMAARAAHRLRQRRRPLRD